jgi:hypothetical protein
MLQTTTVRPRSTIWQPRVRHLRLFICGFFEKRAMLRKTLGSLLASSALPGEDAMRNLLAYGLLIILTTSANAAMARHHATRHHVSASPDLRSSFAADPGWVRAPSASSLGYADTPSYDDPSKLGGQPPCGC